MNLKLWGQNNTTLEVLDWGAFSLRNAENSV